MLFSFNNNIRCIETDTRLVLGRNKAGFNNNIRCIETRHSIYESNYLEKV